MSAEIFLIMTKTPTKRIFNPNKIIISKEEQIFAKSSSNIREYMEKVGEIKGSKW